MKNNNDIKIRKVTPIDVPGIVGLHRKVVSETNAKQYNSKVIGEWLSQITPEKVEKQLKVKTTSWYLIELNTKIIGFCQFPIAKKIIYQLNIDPQYQGKGYGKTLYRFMEKQFKDSGADKIELNSTLNALPFYEHLGFRVVRPIKFKLIRSEMDMLEMVKFLVSNQTL